MNTSNTPAGSVNFGKIAFWYAVIAAIYAAATATFGSIMVNTLGNSFDPGLSTNVLTGSSWFLVFVVSFIQGAIFLFVFTGVSFGFGFLGYKFYDKMDDTTKATIRKCLKWVATAISIGAVIFSSTAAIVVYKAAALAKLGALATFYVCAYSFIIGTIHTMIGGTIFATAIIFIGTICALLAGMAFGTKKSTATAVTEESEGKSESPKE